MTTDSGQVVPYALFVAPAMLAASAMNGAIADTTYNFFFKLKFAKTYDTILATPARPWDIAIGEILWSLIRGGIYSAIFFLVALVMGFVRSWWAVLALPAALLIGAAFAAVGMWATTYRPRKDFEFITLVIQPMFLFSATFFRRSIPRLQARRDAALSRGRHRARAAARGCGVGVALVGARARRADGARAVGCLAADLAVAADLIDAGRTLVRGGMPQREWR